MLFSEPPTTKKSLQYRRHSIVIEKKSEFTPLDANNSHKTFQCALKEFDNVTLVFLFWKLFHKNDSSFSGKIQMVKVAKVCYNQLPSLSSYSGTWTEANRS